MKDRTQVCIIGAGPSGLLLAHLLHQIGIESIVLEKYGRDDILNRMRAGVIDQNTIDVLGGVGFAKALKEKAVIHKGFNLIFDNKCHRIDINELTGGRNVAIYPQQEIVKDLLIHREKLGLPVLFNVSNIKIEELDSSPTITFQTNEEQSIINANFVIGCDGFHGISRQAIPETQRQELYKDYPFSWLGILCEAPQVSQELIYAPHSTGFALISTRSPKLQRMYLQCSKESLVDDWDDEAIWNGLEKRTANNHGIGLVRGKIIQKDIISMRSFVCEKMQFGKLYLVGDAAHIVPPSAAKGLNLAVSDACLLSKALGYHYNHGNNDLLDQYETEALKRFWRAEEFSNFATELFHRSFDGNLFHIRQQNSALCYLIKSRSAAMSFAENYAGIPEDFFSHL